MSERESSPATGRTAPMAYGRDYSRFDQFLDSLEGEIYSEPQSPIHQKVTRMTIETLLNDGLIQPGASVLDIGCGQGGALAMFGALGMKAVGVTLGQDYEVCLANGFNVRRMDQNFMDFADGSFDFVWSRHVLEHSVAPFFTLKEYRRVTRPGGRVYVEVPAPGTSAHHEENPNHYSVLPHWSWQALFARAGFIEERNLSINFKTGSGPDVYWSFLLRAA